MTWRRPVVALLLALLCACARLGPGAAPSSPHPLHGRIWDVRSQTFLSESELTASLARARFVLLGETHDNAEHHRLQARVVEGLAAGEARWIVAFEMISVDAQGALETPDRTPDGLRRALDWDRSGWPDWDLYAPVFVAALDAGLRIAAAAPPGEDVQVVGHSGLPGLDRERRLALKLDAAVPPKIAESLREEIRTAHCGYAPEDFLDRMADVQRLRDAHMALTLWQAAEAVDGAILITGRGHVRRDRAVPYTLRQLEPGTSIASLAFVEVSEGPAEARAQLTERFPDGAPFDYVWFTGSVPGRGDPCERFREDLKRLQAG